MAYIGKTPTAVPLTSSDIAADIINNTHIGDTAISGFDALATAPADTDEFLISDAGTLKRIDASLIGGGGKVLQVVQGTHATEDNFGNTSFQASETDVDITPSATSSKVLVTVSFSLYMATMNDEYVVTLYRDSTNLATNAASGFGTIKLDSAAKYGSHVSFQFLDSPNSTSQLHYEMYIKRDSGSGNAILNFNTNATSTITAIEIGA